MYTAILLSAAALPAIVILFYVYIKDRTEREPGGLLMKLVLGGFLATVFAVLFELLGEKLFAYIPFSSENQMNFWKFMIVVALTEEFFKYLLMRLITWKNPNFNCLFDGVVYAVFTSLGFAILENVFYIIEGGLSTALIRAVTAIPGHASFGVFMGVFYAFAKKQQNMGNQGISSLFRFLAVAIATLAHGIYDYSTTLQSIWGFIGFIIVLFIVSSIMIRKMSKHDKVLDDTGIPDTEIQINEDGIPVVKIPDDGPTSSVGRVIIEPARRDPSKKHTNYRG